MVKRNLSFDEMYDAVRYDKNDRPAYRSICENDDTYESSIKASITIAGGSILAENVKNARIKYSIYVNHRSYGIGGIEFQPSGVAELEYTRVDADGNETNKTVAVDMTSAEIEWVGGDGVYPVEIEVVMDKQDKVVSTKLVVAYWKP